MSPPVRRGRSGARGGPRAGRVAGGAPPSPAREVAARVLERVEADLSFADSVLEAELTAEERLIVTRCQRIPMRIPWDRAVQPVAGERDVVRLVQLRQRVLALLLGSYPNPLDNEPTVRARRPARRVYHG